MINQKLYDELIKLDFLDDYSTICIIYALYENVDKLSRYYTIMADLFKEEFNYFKDIVYKVCPGISINKIYYAFIPFIMRKLRPVDSLDYGE